MRHVPKSQLGVSHWKCALTGRGAHEEPEGFFASEFDLTVYGTDNTPRTTGYRASVSDSGIKEAARQLGWASPEEIEKLRNQVAEYGAQVDALKLYTEKLEAYQDLGRELEVA